MAASGTQRRCVQEARRPGCRAHGGRVAGLGVHHAGDAGAPG